MVSTHKQKAAPKTKNETGQNVLTCARGIQLSDNRETGDAVHQQCIAVILRRTKTVC